MPDSAAPNSEPTATIECPLFPWHSRLNRRYLGLGAMFLILAIWFAYDGYFTWPNLNNQHQQMQAYTRQVTEGFAAAKAAGATDSWRAEAAKHGVEFDEKGEPRPWAAFAAKRGWSERPKAHTQAEIDQQFYLAGALLVMLAIMAIRLFRERNDKLIGHADHMIMPDGRRVNYADAFRLDTRKWDDKGLASVWYREDGSERKAVIDDLKFDGAGKVLDRLRASFHGELIESVPDEPEAEEAPKSGPDSAV